MSKGKYVPYIRHTNKPVYVPHIRGQQKKGYVPYIRKGSPGRGDIVLEGGQTRLTLEGTFGNVREIVNLPDGRIFSSYNESQWKTYDVQIKYQGREKKYLSPFGLYLL